MGSDELGLSQVQCDLETQLSPAGAEGARGGECPWVW